jgi:hypothetical protein
MNSRIGELPDFADDTGLSRFINAPHFLGEITHRKSNDKVFNAFGHNLLYLCKENDFIVANGRLEQGEYTFYNVGGGRHGASVVDYLITNFENFKNITDNNVLDMTEFSDHCPIKYDLHCKLMTNINN